MFSLEGLPLKMKTKKNIPKISVIIPVYNREKLLSYCLKSIYKTKYPNFEVIVVDDASTDNTVKTAERFPCRVVKLKENKGVSYARNTGAAHSEGDVLYFVDSDVVQDDDNISKIMQAFNKEPLLEVLAAALNIKPFNKGFGPAFNALKHHYMVPRAIAAHGVRRFKVSYLCSTSFAIRKNVFTEVGGFNPVFRLGGEEHELGHRISKNHEIYIDLDIVVTANRAKMFTRLLDKFKRSIVYASIYSKRKKFERVGSVTLTETNMVALVFITTTSFISSIVLPEIRFFSFFFLGIFLISRARFYRFLLQQENIFFAIRGIFADYLIYLAIGAGLAIGFLKMGLQHLFNYAEMCRGATKLLFNTLPSHLVLFVTSRCNARCRHCFVENNDKEVSLEQIKKISKNLGYIHYLSITGGEPSLRSDTPDICRIFYENNDLCGVTYHTNGILTSTIVEQIKNIGSACPRLNVTVSLSIDALYMSHDRIRQKEGCFNNAVETLKRLKELQQTRVNNLKVVVNTTYSKFSKDHVRELHAFIKDELNLPHAMCFVRGKTRDASAKEVNVEDYVTIMENWRNEEKGDITLYFKALKAIKNLRPWLIGQILKRKTQVLPCQAGKKIIVISSSGELYPCELLNQSFGSLEDYDYNIRKMLFSSRGKQIKSFIKNKKCFCTWECALPMNIVFDVKIYPKLIKEAFIHIRR